jgi:multiple sugar transport system permease protein
MVGFAFAHLRFRGRGFVLAIVVAGLMLPADALVLPQVLEFRQLHLLGTYWALVLPTVAAPLSVFIFYSFLRGIPSSLIEAVRLDGARVGGGSTRRSACRCAGRSSPRSRSSPS